MGLMAGQDYEERIQGDVIYAALERLSIFGNALKDIVVKVLAAHGIVSNSNHAYSLNQIESSLNDLFGQPTSHIITEKIANEIAVKTRDVSASQENVSFH